MKKRTRPYWDRHWARFDGVYRSRDMSVMYVVMDCGELKSEYQIIKYMTHPSGALPSPEIIHRMAYGNNTFAIVCQMAEGLARNVGGFHGPTREHHSTR